MHPHSLRRPSIRGGRTKVGLTHVTHICTVLSVQGKKLTSHPTSQSSHEAAGPIRSVLPVAHILVRCGEKGVVGGGKTKAKGTDCNIDHYACTVYRPPPPQCLYLCQMTGVLSFTLNILSRRPSTGTLAPAAAAARSPLLTQGWPTCRTETRRCRCAPSPSPPSLPPPPPPYSAKGRTSSAWRQMRTGPWPQTSPGSGQVRDLFSEHSYKTLGANLEAQDKI